MSSPRVMDVGRVLRAARYSYQGLRDAVRGHSSFRQELLLGAMLAPAGVWLGDDRPQRAMLVSSLVLVLIAELLNSAVETVVDRIGKEHSELSRQAKDLGSVAVLLSLVNVPVVWGLVLLG